MDKLSIHIINKDSIDYCDITINSLSLLIDNFNTEIVVVDDCSTDGSAEKLEKVADIFIQEETNRGEARNLALVNSTGEYCLEQLDTDQRIEPLMVTMVKWYMENSPNFALKAGGIISRRDIIGKYGWESVQFAEDKYLWDRLIENNELKFVRLKTLVHPEGSQDSPDKPCSRYEHNPNFNYPDIFESLRDKRIEKEILDRHESSQTIKVD